MMNKLVLYNKTYMGDFDRVVKLYESILKYNKDNIPFYISCPSDQLKTFTDRFSEAIVISDESIVGGTIQQNWFTQQIVKSSFWKTGVCENYVSIDSDGYFIRDFYVSDFMYDDLTPYTVCHEQKELFSWSVSRSAELGFDPKESFTADRLKVMELFGRTGKVYDFGPNPVIWSKKVWESLDNILYENKMSFVDALQICASEFTWYGETMLATEPIRLMPAEPIFKGYHYYAQYLDDKHRGLTTKHLSQNYMGIVLQSNFPMGVIEY